MTGKRFIVIDDGLDFMIRDTITDDDLIDADGVADVLNDYEKENEQLKSFVEYEKRQHKHWKRECLENIKEIGQLKREIVQLKGDVE